MLQQILNKTTVCDSARLPKTNRLVPLPGFHMVVSLNTKMLVASGFILKL